MKKKTKKQPIWLFVLLIGLVFYSLNQVNIPEEEDDLLVIYFPEIADFPNTEEGAVVFDFSFPNVDFKVGEKDADILMFLNSNTIPGLQMGYNINERKLKGGLPVIVSDEITLIDGKPHKLAFAFNKKQGKQWIYLDEKLIAEGEFTGEEMDNALTGFTVKESYQWVESPYGINVLFE